MKAFARLHFAGGLLQRLESPALSPNLGGAQVIPSRDIATWRQVAINPCSSHASPSKQSKTTNEEFTGDSAMKIAGVHFIQGIAVPGRNNLSRIWAQARRGWQILTKLAALIAGGVLAHDRLVKVNDPNEQPQQEHEWKRLNPYKGCSQRFHL